MRQINQAQSTSAASQAPAVLHKTAEIACHCMQVAGSCCCPDASSNARLQVSAGLEKQAEIYTYECDDTVFGMNWSVSLQLCSHILRQWHLDHSVYLMPCFAAGAVAHGPVGLPDAQAWLAYGCQHSRSLPSLTRAVDCPPARPAPFPPDEHTALPGLEHSPSHCHAFCRIWEDLEIFYVPSRQLLLALPPCHLTAHADLSDLQNREDKRFRLAVGTFKEEMQNRVELVTCETTRLELHRLTPCTASESGAPAWPGNRNLLPGHQH